MSPRFRRTVMMTSVAGCVTSATGTGLKLAWLIDWPWWLVAAPAAATLALWLIATLVAAMLVRGMVRHARDFP